jgi:hypothetical protein
VSIPEIEVAMTTRLKGLMKDDFQNCFKKWQERNKCVASQGDYFEGDKFIFVFWLIHFLIRTFTVFFFLSHLVQVKDGHVLFM